MNLLLPPASSAYTALVGAALLCSCILFFTFAFLGLFNPDINDLLSARYLVPVAINGVSALGLLVSLIRSRSRNPAFALLTAGSASLILIEFAAIYIPARVRLLRYHLSEPLTPPWIVALLLETAVTVLALVKFSQVRTLR